MSKKPWSLSTTIRTPERILSFLNVLNEFNGSRYDTKFKIKFERELIQTRNYRPIKLVPEIYQKLSKGIMLSNSDATLVMKENPQKIGWEGRAETHLRVLQELGFFYINNDNKLIISETGKELIQTPKSISNIFLKVLLKWQYPTFFRQSNQMNIVPFIATIHIVDALNKRWKELDQKPIGLSKKELGLFVLSTSDYHNINQTVDDIIKFRQARYKQVKAEIFIKERIKKSYGRYTSKNKHTLLVDYPDNICRYFVLTKLFIYRGQRQYIDLSPLKKHEIDYIVHNLSPQPVIFHNREEEILYKIDINKPELPWEHNLQEAKNIYINKLDLYNKISGSRVKKHDFNTSNQYLSEIEQIESRLRLYQLNQSKQTYFEEIPNCLEELENINSKNSKHTKYADIEPSLRLEYLVSKILIGLDCAVQIKPNYLTDDNGWPIYHAVGGVADIEGYYSQFDAIFEVTLLKNRDQQYKNETQPVMRHLREFEKKQAHEAICMFIAPIIHRDTLNAFWSAVKYEYEGRPQKIIPLTIEQFIHLARQLYIKRRNHKLNQELIKITFDRLLNINRLNSSIEWQRHIEQMLDTQKI